jgi:hypothetical protein
VIVIGVDPHKQSHTAAEPEQATGELHGERTVKARPAGFERHRLNRSGNRLLNWAEGKGRNEALRCLEHHLACGIYRTLNSSAEKMTSTTGPAVAPALT